MAETKTYAQLVAELESMKAQESQLKAQLAARKKAMRPVRWAVSEKGGLSVYELGRRFPVTLYKGEWKRLIAHINEIATFIEAHDAELKDQD